MSWTDRVAIENIKRLRDYYKTKTFVETGTFMGINAELHAKNFEKVVTMEENSKYYHDAKKRLEGYENVHVVHGDSADMLKRMALDDNAIYYLDAHFYNPHGPRWQVKRELEALADHKKCIIIIHDFENNLGHCIYDGEHLGMNVVGDLLKKVNPKFHYYTNSMDFTDIMKPREAGKDMVKLDNLRYAWSSPRLTYRGILYCTPTKLPEGVSSKMVPWGKLFK